MSGPIERVGETALTGIGLVGGGLVVMAVLPWLRAIALAIGFAVLAAAGVWLWLRVHRFRAQRQPPMVIQQSHAWPPLPPAAGRQALPQGQPPMIVVMTPEQIAAWRQGQP